MTMPPKATLEKNPRAQETQGDTQNVEVVVFVPQLLIRSSHFWMIYIYIYDIQYYYILLYSI